MMKKIEEKKDRELGIRTQGTILNLIYNQCRKYLSTQLFYLKVQKIHPSYRATIEQLYFIRRSLFGIHFEQYVKTGVEYVLKTISYHIHIITVIYKLHYLFSSSDFYNEMHWCKLAHLNWFVVVSLIYPVSIFYHFLNLR